MQRVAVVGGGLAGLTCAQTLQAGGCEVVVLEKSRGPGGRLSTRRTESAQYDHGAQYFTVRDPQFASFIDGCSKEGVVAIWQPRRQAPARDDTTDHWHVGTPGMSALGRAQARGLTLKTEQRVMSLERRGTQWQLVIDGGQTLDGFDVAVVAVPNAQALPLLSEHAPQWAAALEQSTMQPCWTVMFSTHEALTEFDAGSPSAGAIAWWARNSSKPGRKTTPGRHDWVLQASADWTAEHVNDDKSQVGLALMQAFGALLGCDVDPIEPPMAHRWLYARRTPGMAPLPEPCWSAALGLGVCGDGLNHSRVEQAYLSGLSLGQTILNTLSHHKESHQ